MDITHEWQGWIAENIVQGSNPHDLLAVLMQHGAEESVALREIQAAVDSPYVQRLKHNASQVSQAQAANPANSPYTAPAHPQAIQSVEQQVAKRDWVLNIYRKLNRLNPTGNVIERKHQLSREEFFSQYYLLNRPVIITGMMEDWSALTRWNLPFLKAEYGDKTVELQLKRDTNPDYQMNVDQHRSTMKLADYIDQIEVGGTSNDYYMTANNHSGNRQALAGLWSDIGKLSTYLNPNSPDDGFFWLGPVGTRTPFHHDLTNNFMAQVVGRKLIRLMPACELPNVYNHFHCFSQVDGFAVDYERFPLMQNAQILECVLHPGEILFLPVGCWHYVQSLDISITMSFINFWLDNDFNSFYPF